MANIDLSNLTRYDGKIKEYAEDKYLSKNIANWQMTEKAKSVTCYPVPDTELEPVIDFAFTETLPASGDKGPDNPSTITGVSSVNITRCGKNLAISKNSLTHNGITFTLNGDGTYTVNGTAASGGARIDLISKADKVPVIPNVPVVISGCPQNGSTTTYSTYIVIYDSDWNRIQSAYDYGEGSSPLFLDRNGYYVYSIIIREGVTVSNLIFKPQLERNSIIIPFELYQGNSYTYQLGNTYYGGKINLATGMMTVTWEKLSFNGSENVFFLANAGTFTQRLSVNMNTWYPDKLPLGGAGDSVSSHFDFYSNNNALFGKYSIRADGYLVINDNTGVIGSTVEEYKSWLASEYNAGHPVSFFYKLRTPYTVQLTPMQIKSLFALDKNTPRLNTLYTDADSIQVGYQKHPARTNYELENAILALGGGE